MAQGYLAQVQALIDQRMKENPEEMKRKLKEIERVKNAPKLTQELIEELSKSIWSGFNIQKVKDLIKRGADIKVEGHYGTKVLYWASCYGDMELVKECLQAGIDVNAKNEGSTPLHEAVGRDNIELAKFLIDSGAWVNAKNKDGYTPLRYADYADSEEMEALLREHGATY